MIPYRSDHRRFAYRTGLLESKDFEKRLKIADEMEKAFLQRYFGNDPEIISFAKLLCHTGNKPAAKELNRVISVLGKKTDAKREMRRRVGCQNGSASPLTPLKNEKGPGRVQPSQGSSVVWHGTNDKAVRTATMPGEVY